MRKRILCLLAAFLLILPSIPVKAVEVSKDNAEFSYTFDNVDGGEISTQSSGRPKVLVFFKTTCGNCRGVLQRLSQEAWVKNGELAEVCAVEILGDSDEVSAFRDTYCQEAGGMIQFGYGWNGNTAMFAYGTEAELATEQGGGRLTISTPVIAVVDGENKLRSVTCGASADSGIEEMLNALKAETDAGQNPDDTQKPDDTQNPDDTQKPDQVPGQGSTDKTESSPGSQSGSSQAPVCNHVTESVLISGATATSDAVAAYRCVKCGAVLGHETVSNSAYASFLDETANTILNAQQSEVVIDAKVWVSFNRKVFEAMKNRPDVAVTVNYSYEGKPYTLKIPAGTDVSLLMDENGFGGFRYIEQVLNTKR